MVVPISGNLNFLPVKRGTGSSVRDPEKLNFEDILLDKVEPTDQGADPGEEQGGKNAREKNAARRDTLELRDRTVENDSQGGEIVAAEKPPGRRIDLRA